MNKPLDDSGREYCRPAGRRFLLGRRVACGTAVLATLAGSGWHGQS